MPRLFPRTSDTSTALTVRRPIALRLGSPAGEETPRKPKMRRLLWTLCILLLAVAAGCGLVLLAGFRLGFDKQTLIVLAAAAALALEAAFWCGAAALGLKAFEARKRIWLWLTGRARQT